VAVSAHFEPPLGPGDAVLFDLDGTLLFLPVDMPVLRQRLEDFHRRHGIEMAFRPLTDHLAEAARRLREELSPAEARAAIRWAGGQVEQAEIDAAASAEPRAAAIEALFELQRRGVWTGVVSNNTRGGIRAALEAVGVSPDSLSALVSRQDVPRPKPAPDSLDLAIRTLLDVGWDPESTAGNPPRLIYAGDAPSDALAAASCEAARIHTALEQVVAVIVGGGRAGSGLLAAGEADHIVADDAGLRTLLIG
jgi:beta-phosphoglucomutase-like phosphatase (HAD superfamily)